MLNSPSFLYIVCVCAQACHVLLTPTCVCIVWSERLQPCLQVTLASDFMWNWNTREPAASFGYDYMLRQCRLRGKVDTDGKVGAYLEERVNVGVNFILSAELDHVKKDYKFGFGMTVGE